MPLHTAKDHASELSLQGSNDVWHLMQSPSHYNSFTL